MIKYFYLYILFLISINIQGQTDPPFYPYAPLIFPDLKPIWYEVNFDSSIIGDSTDGYNYFFIPTDVPDLIDDEFIYSTFYKYGRKELFSGTYIIKRNIYTGQLIWQAKYGFPDDPRQEVARLMYFNKENELEVISQVKPYPYLTKPWNFEYKDFIHSKRIYNLQNGELLVHDKPDYNDTTLYKTRMDYYNRNSMFFKEGDSIRYFQLEKIPNYFIFDFRGGLINYNSKVKEVTIDTLVSTYVPCFNSDFYQTNPSRLGENEYLFIETTDSSDGKLFLRYTDKNLRVKQEYLSDSIGNISRDFQLHRISNDGERYLIINPVIKDNNIFEPRIYEIVILNKEGKLLFKASLNYMYSALFDVLQWNEDNSMKIIAPRAHLTTDTSSYHLSLDLLNVDKNGNVILEKKMVATDSLRYMNTISHHKLKDNKFLLKFREGSLKQFGNSNYDNNAIAIGQMLIDGSFFNINTGTVDIIPELEVNVYPSPTTYNIKIEFLETFYGDISLYNSLGNLIKTNKENKIIETYFDLSDLPQGIYFLKCKSSDSRKVSKSIKIVKI
jgi:Secretion system C-terminal sorting domain